MKCHVLGSLQTISYSTHQDRAPVRSIGNINAIDYVQGQRTIAGTMVFAMFHEHWMTPLLEELAEHVSNNDIWSDELPALNLTISMANEYGYKSNMVIYGVKFIEDGGVMSINDLYTENTLQYVATGIQPLKTSGQYDHSYTAKSEKFKISNEYKTRSWTSSGIQTYKKEWSYIPETISSEGKKEVIPAAPDVPVTITLNQPIAVDKNYIITVDPVYPDENAITNIFATDISTGNKIKGYNPINNTWIISVPEGVYSITYEDFYGNKINNTELITTDIINVAESEANYPVIADIGSTTIKVLANDIEHDCISLSEIGYVDYETIAGVVSEEVIKKAVLYKIEDNTSVGRTNSKEITIEYLNPNTEYILRSINSSNDQDYSSEIRFKTFSSQEEKYGILKNYIMTNEDLLVNREEILSFNYELLKYEYSNIIDAVLECQDFNNDDVKTEMLFYSTKLQNEFNSLYNDYGISNSVDKNKAAPLMNMFDINEQVQSLVVYKRVNDKSYFVTKSGALNNYQYTGKNNIRYYIQPILNNKDKGNYIDFVCYTDNQKKLLSPYNNTNNLQNASFINYETYMNKYDNDLLIAIKAAENLNVHKEKYSMPYGSTNKSVLVVDVDYTINDSDTYYLCISLPEDVLEYTPIRKIPFNCNIKSLTIEPYYSGLLKNKYYLLWIQDKSFNNISKPFILSTYAQDNQIIDYYNNLCMKHIKSMRNNFLTDSIYKYYADLLYSELSSIEELIYKDLELYILQMFLNIFESNINDTLANMLNKILDHMFVCSNHFVAKANLYNNVITFTSDISHYIVAINITADNIKKTVCEEYNMNKETEGLTLLYASNSYSNMVSGYILVNNVTKKIYTSNIIVGGVTNG